MNTWRIQHHTIRVRGAAAAPSATSTKCNDGDAESIPLPSGTSPVASTATRSPVEVVTVKPPTQPRPFTAPHRSTAHPGTVSGRKVVELVLTPRESTFEDVLNPRSVLHHCDGYRYCPPRVELEEPTQAPRNNECEADPAALAERLKLSEQRLMAKRAPKRPATSSGERSVPPRLQLLLSKLSGMKQAVAQRPPRRATNVGEEAAGDDNESPLDGNVDAGGAAAASPTTPPQPSTLNSTLNGATFSDTGNSPVAGRSPDFATKVEHAVYNMLGTAQERIKDTLIHALSDAHREQLRLELDTLTRIEPHCRSSLTNADLSTRRRRHDFQHALEIDAMTQEELEGKLLYGAYLKKIVGAEHRARHDALESRGAAARLAASSFTPHDRAVQAHHRRTHEMSAAHAHQQDLVEEWRRRASERQTLNFHDRVAQTAQQEVNRCATMWASVVLLFAFPRRMVAKRAARMERLLLSRKRKDEHVAHFVQVMRGVLARRRQRCAHHKTVVLRCCVRWLLLFWAQRRRRNAVTEIITWYHGYSRSKPATDMIAKFKKAIIRCQRLVRVWIARRRLEACWTLLKLQQSSSAHHWRPVKPIAVASSRGRGTNGNTSGVVSAKDVRAEVKRDVDALIQRFIADVIPPFSLRMDAVSDALKRQRTAYVADLREYLRQCRLEKKRRALLQKTQPRSPTHTRQDHNSLPHPTLRRPWQRLYPDASTLADLQNTIAVNFATWLKQRIDASMKEHQQRSVSPGGTMDPNAKRWVPSAVALSSWVRDAEEVPLVREGMPFLVAPKEEGGVGLDLSNTALLNRSLNRSMNRSVGGRTASTSAGQTRAAAPKRGSQAKGQHSELTIREAAALYRRALSEM